MLKLKNSGYRKKFRKELLDSILKGFEKMKENNKLGIRPMYRNREWNQEDAISIKKIDDKNNKNSFKKGNMLVFA